MAIINLNKKTFEQKVGKIDEKLKDRISMLGCPIEEETDEEIQVDISPNRPDLLSEQGVARAVAAFTGKKTGLPQYEVEKSNYKVIIEDSVKDVRPFTACAVIKSLKLSEQRLKEIINIQEKLHMTFGRARKKIAIGIYPLDKIKMPITFKAMEPDKIRFRPLESSKEMTGSQILTQHPAGKAYAHLLQGMKKFPIFIDAKGQIMSMPPIINSHETGKITASTKDVFIECSGSDFNSLSKALSIISAVFSDMGGKVFSVDLKYGSKIIKTPNMEPEKMKVSLASVNKLLGLDLNEKDLKKRLEMMNYSYQNGTVMVPPYRADVLHEVDIIEDVAIAYGYENFEQAIPNISTIGKETKLEILKRKTAEALVGLNLVETYSYCVTNEEDECKKMETKEDLVELMNAKTNYNAMRESMLPSLMRILGDNRDVDYPQRIFEMGRVFIKGKYIEENTNLAVALTNSNFTEAKQTMDYLLKMLGLEAELRESAHSSLIEGRTGKIFINGKEVGIIGEVHPKVLSNWKLIVPVASFELNLNKIKELI